MDELMISRCFGILGHGFVQNAASEWKRSRIAVSHVCDSSSGYAEDAIVLLHATSM